MSLKKYKLTHRIMDQTSGKSMNDITRRIHEAMTKLNVKLSDNGKDLCNDLKLIFRLGNSHTMNKEFCLLIEPLKNLSFNPDSLGERMKDVLYKYCHKEDYYFMTDDGNVLKYKGVGTGDTCVIYYHDVGKLEYRELDQIRRRYINVMYMSSDESITSNNLSSIIYKRASFDEYKSDMGFIWVIAFIVTFLFIITLCFIFRKR